MTRFPVLRVNEVYENVPSPVCISFRDLIASTVIPVFWRFHFWQCNTLPPISLHILPCCFWGRWKYSKGEAKEILIQSLAQMIFVYDGYIFILTGVYRLWIKSTIGNRKLFYYYLSGKCSYFVLLYKVHVNTNLFLLILLNLP